MAEKAHILIADISGFTDFNATTAIDHAAHIIAELLEVMIEAEDTGFTLAEIEGDALLMYARVIRCHASSCSISVGGSSMPSIGSSW